MRALTLGLLASIAAAGIAQAAQIGPVADVQITLGKEILNKPRIYGAKEKKHLETELREAVETKVGTSPSGGRLELLIEDAKPNRPTWTQQSYNPSISYGRSYGVGGAKITGVYIAPDGARTPVKYSWYENDIRNSQYVSDWNDVDRTFDLFAKRLKDGKTG